MPTSTQTNTFPQAYQDSLQFILDEGRSIYGQGLPQYTDPRIAGFTPDQTAGFNTVRSNQGSYAPYYQQAAGMAQNAGQGVAAWAPVGGNMPQMQTPVISAQTVGAKQFPGTQGLEAYTNPYQTLVTGQGVRAMEDAYQRAQANADARFAASSAFGGSRQGLHDATLADNSARGIGEFVNKSAMEGWNNATGLWKSDADRLLQADGLSAQLGLSAAGQNASNYINVGKANADTLLRGLGLDLTARGQDVTMSGQDLQAAQLIANLGSLTHSGGLKDAEALLGIGGAQQGLDQRNMDLQYKDFIEQRDYPKTQLNWLNSIVNGSSMNRSGTKSTETPDPSVLAQFVGLGSAGIAIAEKIWPGAIKSFLSGSGGGFNYGSGVDSFGDAGADAGTDWLGSDFGGGAGAFNYLPSDMYDVDILSAL